MLAVFRLYHDAVGEFLFTLGFGSVALGAWCWVHVAIHELGHWVAGVLVGFRILEIRIGAEPERWNLPWGKARLRIGSQPGGGRVRAMARGTKLLRFRYFIFALGGPAATAGMFLGLLRLAAWPPLVPNALAAFFCVLVLLSHAESLLGCLWPRKIDLYGKKHETDGLLMLRYAFGEETPGLIATPRRSPGSRRAPASRPHSSDHSNTPSFAQEDPHPLLTDEVLANYRQTLTDVLPWKSDYATVADSFATSVLFQDRADLREEALQVIDRAVFFCPKTVTLRGTLGGLLFVHGRKAEARPHHEALYEQSNADIDRGITASFLAQYAHADGDAAAALRYAQEAEAKYPQNPLLDRMRTALSLSPQTETSPQLAA